MKVDLVSSKQQLEKELSTTRVELSYKEDALSYKEDEFCRMTGEFVAAKIEVDNLQRTRDNQEKQLARMKKGLKDLRNIQKGVMIMVLLAALIVRRTIAWVIDDYTTVDLSLLAILCFIIRPSLNFE